MLKVWFCRLLPGCGRFCCRRLQLFWVVFLLLLPSLLSVDHAWDSAPPRQNHSCYSILYKNAPLACLVYEINRKRRRSSTIWNKNSVEKTTNYVCLFDTFSWTHNQVDFSLHVNSVSGFFWSMFIFVHIHALLALTCYILTGFLIVIRIWMNVSSMTRFDHCSIINCG